MIFFNYYYIFVLKKEKWARPELNRRPPRCKRDVITTRPLAHVINITYI
jgi:hypothetical protein